MHWRALMSADIGVGDWVESLNDADAEIGFIAVRKGGVYCVRAVDPDPGVCPTCGDCCPGVVLVGDEQPVDWWWQGCLFRPVYRPKAEILDGLREPVKPVKAPAKRDGVSA